MPTGARAAVERRASVPARQRARGNEPAAAAPVRVRHAAADDPRALAEVRRLLATLLFGEQPK